MFFILQQGFERPNILQYSFVLSIVFAFSLYYENSLKGRITLKKLKEAKVNDSYLNSLKEKSDAIINILGVFIVLEIIFYVFYLLAIAFNFSDIPRKNPTWIHVFQSIVIILLILLSISSIFILRLSFLQNRFQKLEKQKLDELN